MNIYQFTMYSFAGAFIWSTALAYGGYKLGANWEDLRTAMRPFDIPIAIIIVLAVVWYVYRHIKHAWIEPSREKAGSAEQRP